VLLCVDYDPSKKSLSPVVFDSISRGLLNNTMKYVQWQQHKTSNTVLQSVFDKVFSKEDELRVDSLKRFDYGHQNRISEGNCGAYTFLTAHAAIEQYSSHET